MKTKLASLGATLTSALTVLAALPYELGEVATIIAPAWKAKLALVGIVATAILRVIRDNPKAK